MQPQDFNNFGCLLALSHLVTSRPLFPLFLWSSVPTGPLIPLFLRSFVPTGPLYPLVLCAHYSSGPLLHLLLWSSVPTIPLVLCIHWSSVPTGSLVLCALCSTGPLFPLFLCSHCSSGPLCPLFHWSFVPTIPLFPLFLWSSVFTGPTHFTLLLHLLINYQLFQNPVYERLPAIISYFRTRYMRDYPQYQCSALPTELTSSAQVTFITAKISFLFTSLSAFQIYDFHIFTVV